ncbi:MAG: ribbon-helix-helix protein, CopG family [Candidatus Hydrogenedentes bacterium]|nr:ribbon-helix-helix protein, CopG family [Candidatus Hydrogenedentota bacterium]
MKIKTSVTLSGNLIKLLDRRAKKAKSNRSEVLEAAAWEMLDRLAREEENARDLEIINRHADFLNKEAADVLTYQIPL